MFKNTVFTLLLFASVFALSYADSPEVLYLWKAAAPGSEGRTGDEIERLTNTGEHIITNVHRPSVIVYLPAPSPQPAPAVLIIPGGGHRELWMDHEGHNVARWLSSRGIAAVILKYRLPGQEGSPYKIADEVTDGKRAIRVIKSNANRWHIDPARIGVLGFSAGGELAARLALPDDTGEPAAQDTIDRLSARIAFQALIYPAHPEIIQPTKDSPTAFLCWGYNDMPMIADGMGSVYSRFRAVHVPVEMHVYSEAGHGFGLRANDTAPSSKWIDRFYEWLVSRRLLNSPPQN